MLAILAKKRNGLLRGQFHVCRADDGFPSVVQAALKPVPVDRHRCFERVGSRQPNRRPSPAEEESRLTAYHANANNFESHYLDQKRLYYKTFMRAAETLKSCTPFMFEVFRNFACPVQIP